MIVCVCDLRTAAFWVAVLSYVVAVVDGGGAVVDRVNAVVVRVDAVVVRVVIFLPFVADSVYYKASSIKN